MTSEADGAAPGPGGLAIEGPDYSPGFWLWHATLRWQREVAAALAPTGLTHVQFVLLSCAWWLNGHGAVPNQLQLARQAGTDVKMTSQVVRKLEAKSTRTRRHRAGGAGRRRVLPPAHQYRSFRYGNHCPAPPPGRVNRGHWSSAEGKREGQIPFG